MRVFLTGATGVVGRRAIPLLIAAGHQVTAVGRTPEKRAALARQGAGPVAVDLFDEAELRRVLPGNDAVVNLATHIPSSAAKMMLRWAWRENDRVRREGSAILARAAAAAGVPRFVQESFAPAYPDQGSAWIDEGTPLAPVTYNRSLLDAERSALQFAAAGGTGVVLRFAAFYGPDGFAPAAMLATTRRGWSPVPGAPEAYLSSISHDDAATAAVASLEVPGGIYNVGDDAPLTRGEYVDLCATLAGTSRPRAIPRWTMPLMGSLGELLTRSVRISNARLRAAAPGWRPRYPSAREGFVASLAAAAGQAA